MGPKSSNPAGAAAVRQRWGLVGEFIGLLVVAVIFLSGQALPELAYRMLTDGVLCALWLASAFGWGCFAIRGRWLNPVLRGVSAIALGIGVLSLLVLGAGSVKLLYPATGWALVGVGAVLAIVWVVVHRGNFAPASGQSGSRAGYASLVVVPLGAIVLMSAFVPPGLLWGDEPNGYDVAEYHLELPREWFQRHSMVPTENNVFSHFPLLVETQYLLAMEMRGGPWAGMYLAQLMHVALCALAVLAVYGFAREENPPAAMTAMLVMAGAPWVALVAPVAYNEGGMLLFGTLALGFGLRAWHGRSVVGSLALAGVFAGFACSVKLTGVPMVLVLVPAALWVSWPVGGRDARLREMLVGTALFGVAAMVVFLPWLVRSYLATHNPVFPELSGILGAGYFSPQQITRWEIANHLPDAAHQTVAGRVWEFWHNILADVRWGFVVAPLAVFASVTAIWRRVDTGVAYLLPYLVGLAVFWTLFTHTQSRFFILLAPVAALLVTQVRKRWAMGIVWGMVAVEVIVSTIYMSGRFAERVVPVRNAGGMGLEDFGKLLPEEVDRALATSKPIALIGDAKAFYYPIDIRRLHYRTVFDVDVKPVESVIEAWEPGNPKGAIEVVDPMELARLAKTYYGIPKLPADFPGPRDRIFIRK